MRQTNGHARRAERHARRAAAARGFTPEAGVPIRARRLPLKPSTSRSGDLVLSWTVTVHSGVATVLWIAGIALGAAISMRDPQASAEIRRTWLNWPPSGRRRSRRPARWFQRSPGQWPVVEVVQRGECCESGKGPRGADRPGRHQIFMDGRWPCPRQPEALEYTRKSYAPGIKSTARPTRRCYEA